jgi:AAA+ superfamily predicted ATPase
VGFHRLNDRLVELVQQFIEAGHDPADSAAGFYISDEIALRYASVADASEFDSRIAEAGGRLGLDTLETAVLVLCAAPELDPRYSKVFGFLHDDVTRKLPSPRLLAEILEAEDVERAEILRCFAATGRLRRLGCIELLDPDGQRPFLDRAIKLAESLAGFVVGMSISECPEGRLRRLAPSSHDVRRAETVARLRAILATSSRLPVVVAGNDAPALLAAALDAPLLVASVRSLEDQPALAEARLVCSLEGRRLAFDGMDDLDPDGRRNIAAALEERDERVVICTRSAGVASALGSAGAIVVSVPALTRVERRAAWKEIGTGVESEEVAERFQLSIAQISTAAEIARVEAAVHARERPSSDDFAHGARRASETRLTELASRLSPSYSWDDLVLPDRELGKIRMIEAYLRHRDRVLTDWGFGRIAASQGLKVLFAGESGTGKTMAARVLANALGLELFQVNLAAIVSKFIGETEKNLDRIFEAAIGSNAILFFDEADSLFGKRSEVSDAHDRYANIEVAYLLQKMDGYSGAIILATNFKRNIDNAFQRRLDFSIDFPFPEPDDRRRIWRLVLPEQAPIAADVDFDFLALQFKLSGGAIRNCSLAAAFDAADLNEPIAMSHLIRSVAREYEKQGRLTLETDFDRYYTIVKAPQADEDVNVPSESEPVGEALSEPRRGGVVVRSRIDEL